MRLWNYVCCLVWMSSLLLLLLSSLSPSLTNKQQKIDLRPPLSSRCCCWAGATINRFQNAFDPDNPIYFLYVLQVSTRSLQGVLNAIAYGFTSPVIREWREGGCCCERGEEGELDYGVVGGQINRQNAENNASRNSDPPKNNYEDNSSGSDDLNNSNNSLKKPLIPQTKQHKHKHSPPKENQKAPLPPARKNSYK